MSNPVEYKVFVTTSHGEIISHTEATTWDVDEAGRLFLYNETTSVATYNANAWTAITRVTEEVYRKVIGTDIPDTLSANREAWVANRESTRRKLQGR